MSINKEVWKMRARLALIIILSIVIGATATYSYIEGKNLYNYIRIGYALAYHETTSPYVSGVSASDPVGEKVFDKENGEVVLDASPQSIIESYDWDVQVAKAVAMAESNMKNDAYNENTNGSYDFCLYQINSIHGYDKEWLSDPRNCVSAAYEIYKKAGRSFSPWVAFTNKQYLYELEN